MTPSVLFRRSLAGLAVTTALAALALPLSTAQDRPAAKRPADLAIVPGDVPWFLSVRCADVAADALGERLLKVIAEDLSLERLGLTPAAVERITLLAPTGNASTTLLVRTVKPCDRDALLKKLAAATGAKVSEQRHGKYTIHQASDPRNSSLCFVDEHVFVFSSVWRMRELLFASVLPGKGRDFLDGALALAAEKHSIVLGLRPHAAFYKPLRRQIKIAEEDVPPADDWRLGALPAGQLVLKPFLLSHHMALSVDLGPTIRTDVRAGFDKEGDARDAEVCARALLVVGREVLPRYLHEQGVLWFTKSGGELVKACEAWVREAAVRRDGTSVHVTSRLNLGKVPPGTAAGVAWNARLVLNPAMRDARDNLKQLLTAMQAHHDHFMYFPPQAIRDKDGKPLLSWRVALLPYLGAENLCLYREFKLDEPWDSDHNKKLLAKRPKVYASVADDAKDPAGTRYQVFVGPKTPFWHGFRGPLGPIALLRQGPRWGDILDGLSNTALIVEAAEPVPWTKPADVVIDPKKPLPKFGGQFPGFFLLGTADGVVRRCRPDFDEKTMRLVIDPQDGQTVEFEQIEVKH
jgi:hypothetical protein